MHILANLATDTSAVKSALLKNPAPPALNCFRSPWAYRYDPLAVS
jgi:hypothetical protein